MCGRVRERGWIEGLDLSVDAGGRGLNNAEVVSVGLGPALTILWGHAHRDLITVRNIIRPLSL
jgi:hypothetical protein